EGAGPVQLLGDPHPATPRHRFGMHCLPQHLASTRTGIRSTTRLRPAYDILRATPLGQHPGPRGVARGRSARYLSHRPSPTSATSRLPAWSTLTPAGSSSSAPVAAWPSPDSPGMPVPATV